MATGGYFTLEDLEQLMMGPQTHDKWEYTRTYTLRRTIISNQLQLEMRQYLRPTQLIQHDCSMCSETSTLVPTTTQCGHFFCVGCIYQWIDVKLVPSNTRITCMEYGCEIPMTISDIIRIIPSFRERVAQLELPYGPRMADLDRYPELKAYALQYMQACPLCRVYIGKDETGCNNVKCPCGQQFCFCCGHVMCIHKIYS